MVKFVGKFFVMTSPCRRHVDLHTIKVFNLLTALIPEPHGRISYSFLNRSTTQLEPKHAHVLKYLFNKVRAIVIQKRDTIRYHGIKPKRIIL